LLGTSNAGNVFYRRVAEHLYVNVKSRWQPFSLNSASTDNHLTRNRPVDIGNYPRFGLFSSVRDADLHTSAYCECKEELALF